MDKVSIGPGGIGRALCLELLIYCLQPDRAPHFKKARVDPVHSYKASLDHNGMRRRAYALQFEGPMRQWDVVGSWEPLSDPRPSAVIDKDWKWLVPTWKDVDESLILRWMPTKTEDSSGETVMIDLRACPMVMAELEMTLDAGKPLSGPLIIDKKTFPYSRTRFEQMWIAAKEVAGINEKVWNRDLRKSGSTEARRAGAPIDDVKQGHGIFAKQRSHRARLRYG